MPPSSPSRHTLKSGYMAFRAAKGTQPLSKPISPLLALPPEVRNCIYDAVLEWPDIPELAKGMNAGRGAVVDRENCRQPLCTIPRPHFGSMNTPALLLLNRQITSEALEILYQKPFIMDSMPPYIPQLAKPMDITEFISENTLQNLRFVVLKMNLNHKPNLMSGGAKGWLKTVEMLLDIWFVKNNLERVEVQATYTVPPRDLGWTFEATAHHRHVMRLLSMLRGFGEQVPVIFDGEFADGKMERDCVSARGEWYDVVG